MTSDYLFAQPTFRSGIASLANLEGKVFYNTASTPEEADAAAIFSDWQAVGDDLREALAEYGQNQ